MTKYPRPGFLKRQRFILSQLWGRSQSRCRQGQAPSGSGEPPSHLPQLLCLQTVRGLWSRHPTLCLCHHAASPCVSLAPAWKDAPHCLRGPASHPGGSHFEILTQIDHIKTLFPNKGVFRGSDGCTCGGCPPAQSARRAREWGTGWGHELVFGAPACLTTVLSLRAA